MPRTSASHCATAAYQRWKKSSAAERPLAKWCGVAAQAFFAVLKARDVSNLRVAQMLGVHESRVRRYGKDGAHVPIEVLLVLPLDVALEYVRSLFGLRGAASATAFGSLRSALAELEKPGAVGRSDLPALIDIQGRLAALLARAAQEAC